MVRMRTATQGMSEQAINSHRGVREPSSSRLAGQASAAIVG
jgi:hypothetical protein